MVLSSFRIIHDMMLQIFTTLNVLFRIEIKKTPAGKPFNDNFCSLALSMIDLSKTQLTFRISKGAEKSDLT